MEWLGPALVLAVVAMVAVVVMNRARSVPRREHSDSAHAGGPAEGWSSASLPSISSEATRLSSTDYFGDRDPAMEAILADP